FATGEGAVAILYGDTPLLRPQTVRRLTDAVAGGAGLAVLGFRPADPAQYGRLVTDASGRLLRIVEHADASPAERAIGLCNSGVLAFSAALGRRLLPAITDSNAKREFYLTDLAALAAEAGHPATIIEAEDAADVLGVNSQADLAAAEGAFQSRMRAAAMASGVTLIDPATVWFSYDTRLGRDVTVGPNVVFGPGVSVADGVEIRPFSHLEGASIGSGATIGPFARLRPGAELGPDVHIGNFVEIKKARIDAGAKVNHLTYIGDAEIGARTNIGAGTITCNYDGFDKNRTIIGADAFIGSDTLLIAPVTLGDGAYTGSGTVVTRDVPADTLVVTRPELTSVPGWPGRFKARKAREKAARANPSKGE
ncbi:MAG: bifunctional UDP-N-acetylglucosamine diphosphorylase/glucosamine-1-phosphate N-acetyltransferase GlmU, partial [Alphaproteobacteria bacterium]|nr:bifunctional UDP-N-acetylglucosamine diphosphorylase/glucosamine-1-phosphate N-acetyltransferase GlmU [Alphaproteobacteria bacterium]